MRENLPHEPLPMLPSYERPIRSQLQQYVAQPSRKGTGYFDISLTYAYRTATDLGARQTTSVAIFLIILEYAAFLEVDKNANARDIRKINFSIDS